MVQSYGFKVHESNKCVYSMVKGEMSIVLCLSLDDILLFGSDLRIINKTKLFLSSKFEMKDMGVADVILGPKLTRSVDGISISLC